jgi:hypothetical protein
VGRRERRGRLSTQTNLQKFFGSFFQKRTPSFLLHVHAILSAMGETVTGNSGLDACR